MVVAAFGDAGRVTTDVRTWVELSACGCQRKGWAHKGEPSSNPLFSSFFCASALVAFDLSATTIVALSMMAHQRCHLVRWFCAKPAPWTTCTGSSMPLLRPTLAGPKNRCKGGALAYQPLAFWHRPNSPKVAWTTGWIRCAHPTVGRNECPGPRPD